MGGAGAIGRNMQIVLLSRHNYDECGDAIQGREGGSSLKAITSVVGSLE